MKDIEKKIHELDKLEQELAESFKNGEIDRKAYNFEVDGVIMTRQILESCRNSSK